MASKKDPSAGSGREATRRSRGRRPGLLARATAALVTAIVPGTAAADAVVGERAPAFSFEGSDGKTYTLEKLLEGGEQGIVLAFFPKAFTPG